MGYDESTMKYILILLVFAFGLLQPFQAGINSRMGAVLGDRVQAGFINGFVNVCLISLVLIVLLRGFPSLTLLKDAPWWAYLGGAIGAGVVTVQLIAAPVLGAGLLVAFFVAGQLSGSLIADTWGLVGYPVRSTSLVRLLAMVLIMVGVVLALLTDSPAVADPGVAGEGASES